MEQSWTVRKPDSTYIFIHFGHRLILWRKDTKARLVYKWPHFVLPLTHRNPSTFLSLIQAPTVETPRTRTCGCWGDMFVDFLFVAPFDDDAHPKQTGQLTRMGSASNWLPWVVFSCIIRFPKGSRLKGSLTCGSILCRASPAWANQDNCTLSNRQLSRIISVPV